VKVEAWDEEGVYIAYIPYGERAKAVGRGGINVHLASELTWCRISLEELPQTEGQKEEAAKDQSEKENKEEK
jgi:transcription antitermination factor NusA-like protein